MLTLSVDRVGEVATITNTGGQPISLAGFTLRSVKGDQRFTFGAQVGALQPNSTLRVKSGPSATGNVPGTINWTTNFIWNNESDPAELIDSNMTVVAEEP
jgi:Lamin Tail Domain